MALSGFGFQFQSGYRIQIYAKIRHFAETWLFHILGF